jgi:3-methylfumaryl-CoA hydratase
MERRRAVSNTGYGDWIGKEERCTQPIELPRVLAMAATLDLDQAPLQGEALPPGWQWLFFNPIVNRSGLGSDGHPRLGGFLPPIELPRRMWAGSRIRYLAELPVGEQATRSSRILKIEAKSGKSGSLVFVTLEHTISCGGTARICEEQDLVYREAATAAPSGAAASAPYDGIAQWSREVRPDTTLLFRYSALTFNGHRIHYDQVYAREQEKYPALVVHGPLTATLLQQFACDQARGRSLTRFDFRGITPLFVDRPFQLEGRQGSDGKLTLWARGPDGELAMSATAEFS